MKMKPVLSSAPGKVILAGEHAVVYGHPAIVAAIDRRVRVKVEWLEQQKIVVKDKHEDLGLVQLAIKACLKELGEQSKGLKIEINSNLPVGCGLGSSAALATAIVWSLLKDSPLETRDKVVKQIEDWQHGKSSGVDQAVVREGGMIWFRKDQGIKRLKVKNLPEFLLISSGVPVENTGEMVAAVAARYKRQPAKYQQIFKRMGAIAEQIFNCQKPIFNLIKENERLLEKIGVVGEKAKEMVKKIEQAGGMAKVCGAGGTKGGSGVLLGYHEDIGKLKQLVKNNNWQYYQVKLGAPGVKYGTN